MILHEIVSRKALLSPNTILTYFDVDIVGPFKIKGLKDEKYFTTITGRKTRAIWVYPMKYKSDIYNI